MAINYINTGSSSNKGDGDTLRTAFNKINANFKYLNLSTGVQSAADIAGEVFSDNSLHSGISVFYSSEKSRASLTLLPATTSSIGGVRAGTGISISDTGVISVTDLSNVNTNISPIESNTYDIGSNTKQWNQVWSKEVYLNQIPLTIGTDSTLWFNGQPIGTGPTGASAYEIAVNSGFSGSEAEWLGSLIGPQGEQGPLGPPGPKGEIGPASLILGSISTSTDLPLTANLGDSYIVTATGHLYVFQGTDTGFIDVGQVVGPKGDTGEQGAQGPIGPKGLDGAASIGNYSFNENNFLWPDNARLNAGGIDSDKSLEISTSIVRETTTVTTTSTVEDKTFYANFIQFNFNKITYPSLGTSITTGTVVTGSELTSNNIQGYDGQNYTSTIVVSSVTSDQSTWFVLTNIPDNQNQYFQNQSGFDLTFSTTSVAGIANSSISIGVKKTSTFTGITIDSSSTVISSNLIPNEDIIYDLGSSTTYWKDLYLGNSIKFSNGDTQTTAWTGGYSPANAADWAEPAPTTIVDALDRLAAAIKILSGGSGA